MDVSFGVNHDLSSISIIILSEYIKFEFIRYKILIAASQCGFIALHV